jgi:hypothetical protein
MAPLQRTGGTVRIFGYEPAVIMYALNAVVALLVAWGLHLTTGQVDAVSVIATSVLSIAVAVMTRPIVVSGIAAAAASGLTALAAFGLDLSQEKISTTVMVGSIVMMFLLRPNVTPTAKLARL